jgi:hypothetical protein
MIKFVHSHANLLHAELPGKIVMIKRHRDCPSFEMPARIVEVEDTAVVVDRLHGNYDETLKNWSFTDASTGDRRTIAITDIAVLCDEAREVNALRSKSEEAMTMYQMTMSRIRQEFLDISMGFASSQTCESCS